ncbi:hypothetical protein QE394_001091 [Arthrobacter sp. SORGH_AS 212]|uniref:hypothetical protein n=1 Tax=Pseudarthrobacter sp. SORGH_AS 212 TaxID=3041777 RepID=UPI00277EA578|nr:hypothetical protein [Arthrobacter sp. SORGH_AS_0212]
MTAIKPLLLSLLRTVVSWVWALFIGWLLVAVPIFQPFEEQLLGVSELALPTLVAIIAAAWYAAWRWVEPRLPDWLTAAALGSSKAPVYPAIAGSQVTDVNPPLDRVPGPDHRA